MNAMTPAIQIVDTDDLEDYPISAHDRLDSHYFFQWNLKRWRASTFRRKADPDVGWYGFQLFCIAQDETPIGTLPDDDEQLAYELRLPLEEWRKLMKRAITPLHNWHRVKCDNGEIRLAHPVVTEVAEKALDSKRTNAAKNADERMRKRLDTISRNLAENIPGGARVAKNDELVNRISDWIAQAYPGGSATVKRIQEAWEALSQPT
ncbi:hypothetical protein [Ruegeria sp. Ofav3-42]|uniref:hypothetical protein n=1 Tax=Ruegeria sp. Ofav3-42 TaxID=2917759 RepID=UPI001EF5191E|nr:hypothetical protein [Ruegeria sp. Ofav3-42]MCG7520860.1 hypothetical protein [Ruegeria sp. Ofav3-42]